METYCSLVHRAQMDSYFLYIFPSCPVRVVTCQYCLLNFVIQPSLAPCPPSIVLVVVTIVPHISPHVLKFCSSQVVAGFRVSQRRCSLQLEKDSECRDSAGSECAENSIHDRVHLDRRLTPLSSVSTTPVATAGLHKT